MNNLSDEFEEEQLDSFLREADMESTELFRESKKSSSMYYNKR